MPDSSTLYMASGYLPSQDGREILLYYSGSAHTHGGIATPDAAETWGNNVSSQHDDACPAKCYALVHLTATRLMLLADGRLCAPYESGRMGCDRGALPFPRT